MTLSHIDNDDVFVNHDFKPSTFKSTTLSPGEQKKQIDQDYLIALSIEEEEKKLASQNQQAMLQGMIGEQEDNEMQYNMISDEELARKLQEEEDNREREEYFKNKRAYETNRNKMVQTVDESPYNPDWNQQQRPDHQQPPPQQQLTHRNVNIREPRNNELLRNKRLTNQNSQPLNSPTENHTQSSSNSSRDNRSNHSNNHSSHSHGHHSKNKVRLKIRMHFNENSSRFVLTFFLSSLYSVLSHNAN